ncbi:MAG: prepilin-type N-terminal cleavage/methylation domain-containing protein, partial [Phycisphaerales bacterium]
MNRSLRPPSPRARGLTLIELLVVLVVLVAIVVVFWPAGPRYHSVRQLKDSTHVRAINQGLILWANDNQGRYPVPSLLDAANSTVAAEVPESKDTMANVLSILVYNGFFSTELLVTPAEVNPNIKIFDRYQYEKPEAAADADKSKALWDPALSVDFTNGKTGHTSYAM